MIARLVELYMYFLNKFLGYPYTLQPDGCFSCQKVGIKGLNENRQSLAEDICNLI